MSDDANAPTCPSCGVPYGDHLGLHGTCAEVQQLRTQVDRLTRNAEAREGSRGRENDLLRAAQRERDELRDEVTRLRAALVDSQRLYGAAHARGEALALALRDLDHLTDLHRSLNRRTAEALGLLGERVDPETGRRYLPSWHDMPERVAAIKAGLAEALGWMTESGHPGEDCLRSGWVRVQRVAELRRLVDGGR